MSNAAFSAESENDDLVIKIIDLEYYDKNSK